MGCVPNAGDSSDFNLVRVQTLASHLRQCKLLLLFIFPLFPAASLGFENQPMADTKNQEDLDPRHRLAQRYLQAARDNLAAKESELPKTQRQRHLP